MARHPHSPVTEEEVLDFLEELRPHVDKRKKIRTRTLVSALVKLERGDFERFREYLFRKAGTTPSMAEGTTGRLEVHEEQRADARQFSRLIARAMRDLGYEQAEDLAPLVRKSEASFKRLREIATMAAGYIEEEGLTAFAQEMFGDDESFDRTVRSLITGGLIDIKPVQEFVELQVEKGLSREGAERKGGQVIRALADATRKVMYRKLGRNHTPMWAEQYDGGGDVGISRCSAKTRPRGGSVGSRSIAGYPSDETEALGGTIGHPPLRDDDNPFI